MTLPGSLAGAVPDGPDWLVRAVRDLQRDVSALRTATPAQMVRPVWVQQVRQGFDLSVAPATLMSQRLALPPGFRVCVLPLVLTVGAWNSRTAADTVIAQIQVAGGADFPAIDEVSPSMYGSVTAVSSSVVYADNQAMNDFANQGWPISASFADADGTFTVAGTAYTGGAAWTHVSSPGNQATLSGVGLFMR